MIATMRSCARYAHIIMLVYLCCAASADEYRLNAFSLSATTPVTVTIGTARATEAPVHLPPGGEWTPLEIIEVNGASRCVIPAHGSTETLVLLSKPQWLHLPDTDAPRVAQLLVDETPVPADDGIHDLGWLAGAPQTITLSVVDELNPIAVGGISAYLNGRPLEDSGSTIELSRGDDARSATIAVRLGALSPDRHRLSLSVPDATPHANTRIVALSFDTSPLLRNGDFEQGGGAAFATHWRHAAWGRRPETEYETVVAEGEGRSGNAVRLTGIADPLYLILGQKAPLIGGRTYILRGYYRTEGDQKVGASFNGTPAGELKQQYVESDPFPSSADWAPFEWELSPEEGHPEYEVFVWSKSKGSVWFDDLELVLAQ